VLRIAVLSLKTAPSVLILYESNKTMITLSSKEARQVLVGSTEVSLDLGKRLYKVKITGESVTFPDGQSVELKYIKKIASDNDNVFLIDNNEVMKASFFSKETKKLYTLRPTATSPALEISGILMHRIKDIEPKTDAENKIAAISPLHGNVLDTCCGLGYTAILAAKSADVTTIEKDPNVLELCRVNPYSQELFTNKRIKLIQGDTSEEVKKFKESSFNAIIHDPPSVSIAGELYSDEFYSQLFRVLKPGGKLLHYTGAPGSRGRGMDLSGSVARRLKKTGFRKVVTNEKTQSVVAVKH